MDETTTAPPTDATQPPNDAPADATRPQTIEDAVNIAVGEPAPTAEPQPAVEPTNIVTPAEEPTDIVPAVNAPPVSDAVIAPAPATEESEDESEYIPPAQPVPPIDPKAFVDENGFVDVNKLTEAINQTISGVQQTASNAAQRELAANRAEERQWNAAIEKFPELKTDRTLRDFVQQARIGKTTEAYRNAGNNQEALSAIKIPTPTQIASELFKRMGQAKTEGVQSATETTTIARSNVPLTSGQPAPTTSQNQDLFNKARDPRDRVGAEQAQRELLKNLLFAE